MKREFVNGVFETEEMELFTTARWGGGLKGVFVYFVWGVGKHISGTGSGAEMTSPGRLGRLHL